MTQNPQIEAQALLAAFRVNHHPDAEPSSVELAALSKSIAAYLASQEAAAPSEEPVATFQDRVQPWMMACFGAEISGDKVERGDRLLEEVLELLQSGGYDPARVGALRDYVWGRPAGEPPQEVGGVQVTLAAYCLAFGLDMHTAGETELARIWTKVDKIRAKQAAKPVGSALPVASPAVAPVADAKQKIIEFAQAILHGDDEHRGWLMEAAHAFNAGDELPAPRGKGTAPVAPVAVSVKGLETKLERALAANSTRPDYDLVCEECGRAHILDTVIPSDVWNQIAEPHNILCTLCIDKRLLAKGMRAEAEFYYVGSALISKLYEDAALSSIPATKGGEDVPPKRETQEYLLRAMGTNYSAGNLWDHLDKDVVLKAADEIKALRAALNDRIQPLAAALSAQDTDGEPKSEIPQGNSTIR